MSKDVLHIDDGRLHAWLDGALGREGGPDGAAVQDHLKSCDQCRARLESARVERDRARSILASADDQVPAPPPFADVVQRARATTPASRKGPWRSSSVRLAWAASIAVVAGAGLLGRELAQQRGRDLPAPFVSGRQETQPYADADAREAQPRTDPGVRGAQPNPDDEALESPLPMEREALEPQTREGAIPIRQKSEANTPDAAARRAAEPVPEAREMNVRERLDADLAAGVVRPGDAVGHAGLGCWRLEPGVIDPEIPGWLRLTEEPIPGRTDGSLRLETDLASQASGDDPVSWLPLGADSVRLSIPPRIFRLAAANGHMHGESRIAVGPQSDGLSRVRYGRIECPIR